MSLLILILFSAVLFTLVIGLLFLLIRKPRVGVVVLGVLLCAFAAAVLTLRFTYQARLPRFANDVKAVCDPHELQNWAVLMLGKTNPESFDLPLQDVPKPLQNMRSRGLTIEMAFYGIAPAPKDSCIVLMWGGGFGHWGMDIGGPSFRQPNDDNRYIQWIPGIYFWEETE